MSIPLQHRAMVGMFRYERLMEQAEKQYGDLCAAMADLRETMMSHEYDLTGERYNGYFDPQDMKWALEFGALIVREADQCEKEIAFDFTCEQVHCERLTRGRKEIDRILIDVLREMGWSESRLASLTEGLDERARLAHDRRMEMVYYDEVVQLCNDKVMAALALGRAFEACELLQELCDMHTAKLIEISDQLDQYPAVDA